jgi:NADH-quinone oxidoreductase subunit N
MFPARDDLLRVAPEAILCLSGIVLMLVEPFLTRARRPVLVGLATAGATLALLAIVLPATHLGAAFSGLLLVDGFAVFVQAVVGLVALLVILGSADYLDREHIQHGEYYALVLFATAGMGVMASAGELVTAFVGLEVSSISTYILASYRRDSPRSNESALKYFLLGSFATAFFLYGVALLYGATGTTQLAHMTLRDLPEAAMLFHLGLALVLVGLGFKVAVVPFQLWTPDVYEGAPSPVTALLSSGPKAAAFALLLRILVMVPGAGSYWFWALWVSAVLTMFGGNLAALAQSSVKRMLAYSSIAHAGYILVAVTAAAASSQTDQTGVAVAAVLYYLAVYALMKLGAFIMVAQLGGAAERHLEIDDMAGLASRQPVAAACFSLFLFSLLGLPVTAGFLGKLYLFNAALSAHLVWLAVFLALNTTIGAFYYLRVIVVMYMREPHQDWPPARVRWATTLVLLAAACGTIYLGLFPGRVMGFATQAARSLPAESAAPLTPGR